MKNILIIDTGGTFNKVTHPKTNKTTIVDNSSIALKKIALHWRCNLTSLNIIGKDSLDMTNLDRLELLMTINNSEHTHIIVIHGTDTIDLTAQYLAEAETEKCIVLTGAMVPFSNDLIEATANFASAYGYINALPLNHDAIYIAMNGLIKEYDEIVKDHAKGRFVTRDLTPLEE